jgi:hypothetical protein
LIYGQDPKSQPPFKLSTLNTADHSLTVVGPFEVTPDMEKGCGVAEIASWANPDVAAVC